MSIGHHLDLLKEGQPSKGNPFQMTPWEDFPKDFFELATVQDLPIALTLFNKKDTILPLLLYCWCWC
jgi:hypothetical protein